jgi:cell wall-associated NlpC family hydrolase
MDIKLPEFPRRWMWWEDTDQSMYDYHLPRTGFYEVREHQKGDVCLMKIQARINNHAGIVLDGDAILHHLVWRQSRQDSHSRWLSKITAYWRYSHE